MKKVRLKEAKGITLVALVITVIILLILAGVALSLVIGENGLIAKSKTAVEKYKDREKEEQWQLEDFEAGMEQISLEKLEKINLEKLEKINIDELEDEEEHPELKTMKLELNITKENTKIDMPAYPYSDKRFNYNCTVDWGDETEKSQVTSNNFRNIEHTYVNTGTYTIVIDGTCESLYMRYNNELVKIKQWGTTNLKRIYLEKCYNLKEIATPSKNSFKDVTNFANTFSGCSSLTSIPEKIFAN